MLRSVQYPASLTVRDITFYIYIPNINNCGSKMKFEHDMVVAWKASYYWLVVICASRLAKLPTTLPSQSGLSIGRRPTVRPLHPSPEFPAFCFHLV